MCQMELRTVFPCPWKRLPPQLQSWHRAVPWPGLSSPPLLFFRLPWCRRRGRPGWDSDLSTSALLTWLTWGKIFSFAKHVFLFVMRLRQAHKFLWRTKKLEGLDGWLYRPFSCPLQLDLASFTIPPFRLLKDCPSPYSKSSFVSWCPSSLIPSGPLGQLSLPHLLSLSINMVISLSCLDFS